MSWVWHRGGRDRLNRNWNTLEADPLEEQWQHQQAWERRGRGYQLFSAPVALEPPFTPFWPLSPGLPVEARAALQAQAQDALQAAPAQAVPTAASPDLGFLTLHLPPEQKVTPPLSQSFWRALRALPQPLAFEVVADHRVISYQIACAAAATAKVAAQVEMHFSLAEAALTEDGLRARLHRLHQSQPQTQSRMQPHSIGYQVIDFGLSRAFYRPIALFSTASAFALDPLASIVGALGQLEAGEVAGLQLLLAPAQGEWAVSVARLLAASSDRELLHQVDHKFASPLFACALRVFGLSRHGDHQACEHHAFELCRRIGAGMEAFTAAGANSLIALDNAGYDDEAHLQDVLERQSRRQGMLLSEAEVAGLAHPPAESLHHPRLSRLAKKQVPLPESLGGQRGVLLGTHRYRGQEGSVVWPDTFRTRHCYLLGKTRLGKSTLLLNLIRQDMERGQGLCLLDPHGDLAQDVLGVVPPEREEDVLYLDLSDRDFPPALNLLEAGEEWQRRLLCSDLLSVLQRLFASSWGDRLEHILRHVLLTLLAAGDTVSGDTASDISPPTLRDVRRLLGEASYRERVLRHVHDPDLLAFWRHEFPGLSASTFAPIHNKLGLLLSSPLVRNILSQSQNRLDFARLIRQKKIVLINLSASLIGEDNAHLLGALLVSRLHLAAMSNLRHDREQRVPFTLYADEFQHFVVSSFETMLSEAGKAGLSLVMANQFLTQLGPQLQGALLGNVGTLLSFGVGTDDARLLEKEFGGRFSTQDILSLGRGEVIGRIGPAQHSFNLSTLPPPQPLPEQEERVQRIIEQTRQACCRPRLEVEAELRGEVEEWSPEGSTAGSTGYSKSRGRNRTRHPTLPLADPVAGTPVPDRAAEWDQPEDHLQEALDEAQSNETQGVAPLIEPMEFGWVEE